MARKTEPETADYADVVTALKERGFGADLWHTGGGIYAVAATIDGRLPDDGRAHLLLTATDGPWYVGFCNGDPDHDMTERATCVELIMLAEDATADQVADELADLVVSLLGPANLGARRMLARPRAIRHRVRVRDGAK